MRIVRLIEVKLIMEEKKPSTVDILASIRARKAPNVADSLASAVPEIVQSAPLNVVIVEPTGAKSANAATTSNVASEAPQFAGQSRPSIQDMLKAVREGKVGEGAAKSQPDLTKTRVSVAAPPMLKKPVIAVKSPKPVFARRRIAGLTSVVTASAVCFMLGFLTGSNLFFAAGALTWVALMTPFTAAWASIASISGIWTLGTARFMFPNVLVEPPSRFKVGPLSDYPLNTVSNKWKDQFGIWIVHTDQFEGKDVIYALTTICTHLGCTPNWLDGEQKFKCPCHGSGFYITGVNFEGPAPRPLERTGLRIAEDGMLEVNKSVKFQEEMGQWTDPTSFVSVV